jgi:hypothetical protein
MTISRVARVKAPRGPATSDGSSRSGTSSLNAACQKALRLERRPGRNPLFDVGFTLQNQLDVQMRESSRHLQITEIRRDIELSSDAEAETDLWFIVRPDEGELAVQVVYNGARFSPGLVDRLLQDLLAIVSAAAPTSDTTLKSIVLTANDTGRAGRKITIDLGL